MTGTAKIKRAKDDIKTAQELLGFTFTEYQDMDCNPTAFERVQIELLNLAQDNLAVAYAALAAIEKLDEE